MRGGGGGVSKLFNGHVAVCGFFIISGFLITKSYSQSKTIKEYFIKRCRRLLPGYWLITLLPAVGFSLVSTLPAREYFTSPLLYKHIAASLSFMNFMYPELPGVFINNRVVWGGIDKALAKINGSLWTIRIEVIFYILVPIIIFVIGRLKTRKRINILLVAAYIFGTLYGCFWGFISKKFNWWFLYGMAESSGYIQYFTTGVFCLINLDWIKKHFKISIIPAVIIVVLEYMYTFNPVLELFLPAALAVVIMFIAFNFKNLQAIGKTGDYSYGIYIFHWPLIQLFVDLGYYNLNKYITIFSVVCVSFTLAYMSWHFIEKRALKRY
jgi:peptidoglycan/LPS O-acetylase OafA/YrhL